MVNIDFQKYTAQSGPIVLWAWIAFTSFYTLMSFAYPFVEAKQVAVARETGYTQGANEATQAALASFSGNVFQNGQLQGQQLVVSQLIQELAKQYEGGCKEIVPVNIGTGSIGVLSTACYEQLMKAQPAATPTPTPAAQ